MEVIGRDTGPAAQRKGSTVFHPDFVLRDDRARSEAAARRSEQLTAVRRARAEARARARERAAKRRRRAS